jgi:dTDP-glucose pyrophosphorylase
MSRLSKFIISENCSLKKAIFVINETASQIALVVKNQKLIGIVTDGDIRRALLGGLNLNSKIEKVMQRNYTFLLSPASKEDALKLMKNKILKQIPLIDNNKNLIDLFLLDELIKLNPIYNEVVIMLGGRGTRLGELTKNCPKPMLKVGSKPILEIILQQLIEHGFKNFYFSVNYLKSQIKKYFKNGSRWGVNIKYLEEKKPLGTAGSIKLLQKKIIKPFLVINGDVLTRINYNHLINFHSNCKSQITMCVKEYKTKIPYGIAKIKDHNVIGIEEKPELIHFINAGIYCLNPSIIKLIPKNTYFDMTDLITLAKKRNINIKPFLIHEYWQDVGYPLNLKNIKNVEW